MTIRERFAPLWAAAKNVVARRSGARQAPVVSGMLLSSEAIDAGPITALSNSAVASPPVQPASISIRGDRPNLPHGSKKRLVDPIVGEWVQLLPKIPPDQLRAWMLSGSQGSFYAAYSVYSVMEDQWPKLRKNLHEIREASSRCRYKVTPFAPEGEEPTPLAIEKAKAFGKALRSFKPNPVTDERGFEQTVYDLTNALIMGVTAQEILWDTDDEGMWVPRATAFVFPPQLGFTADRNIGIQSGMLQSDYWSIATATELDPNKFLIGQYQTRSGPCTTFGLLRPLAWWFGAVQYMRDWFMKSGQIYSVPIRWVNYPANSSAEMIAKIEDMLDQMGSSGWGAFIEGTTIQLLQHATSAGSNPQIILMDMADRYADLMILGQTLTSDVADSGSRALGSVHANTKEERMIGLASWVASGPLDQLARAWNRLNYDDEEETPVVRVDTTKPEAKIDTAKRLQIVLSLPDVKLERQAVYDELGYTVPDKGEETVGGQPALPPGTQVDENGQPIPPEAPGDKKVDPKDAEKEKPEKEDDDVEKEDDEEKSDAREMLKAAMGNGDKHNRVYTFRSEPMQAGGLGSGSWEAPGQPRFAQAGTIKYSPQTNSYNDRKLIRGDVLVDENGNRYALDRANGYMLTVTKLGDGDKETNKSYAFSVDHTDAGRYMKVSYAGQNIYDGSIATAERIFCAESGALNKAVTDKFLTSLAQTNRPLADRLLALAGADEAEFLAEAQKVLHDFPKLARKCLASKPIKEAAKTLEEGMSAELANGLTQNRT